MDKDIQELQDLLPNLGLESKQKETIQKLIDAYSEDPEEPKPAFALSQDLAQAFILLKTEGVITAEDIRQMLNLPVGAL